MTKVGKEKDWIYIMAIVMLIILMVGFVASNTVLPCFMFVAIVGLYAINAFLKKMKKDKRLLEFKKKNRQQIMRQKEIESILKECQIKMRGMLPQLKREFEDVREQFIRKNGEMLDEEQRKLFADLPEVF